MRNRARRLRWAAMEDDGLSVAAVPHCAHCGTVLRPAAHGYWCAGCHIVAIGV
jgi:hypothetical protein